MNNSIFAWSFDSNISHLFGTILYFVTYIGGPIINI